MAPAAHDPVAALDAVVLRAHGLYLVLIGWLSFALTRRLAPWSVPLAFVTGVLAATWAPSDHARLNTLGLTWYSGHTLGTLLAVVLFAESWVLRRPCDAGGGAGSGPRERAGDGGGGACPRRRAAPADFLPRADLRRTLQWGIPWMGVVALAGVLALWPVVFPPATGSRQHSLGLDLRPAAVLERLALQFGFHVLPLVRVARHELAHAAVLVAAAVGGLFFHLVAASSPTDGALPAGPVADLLALGLVLRLGYAAFSLTGSLALPVRTEFFSAPGIALALASAAFLAASFLPARWRRIAVGVALSWAIAVGMGRTLAMQRDWTAWGTFPAQASVLRQLTVLAPDLRPGTLVVLLDGEQAFKASYTFRHAVSYLYGGRALGSRWGASDFLYPSRFGADGVSTEPMAVIQGPWRSPPAFHRYDELVVVRMGPDGRLTLLDQWPYDRLPLPGARCRASRAHPARGTAATRTGYPQPVKKRAPRE